MATRHYPSYSVEILGQGHHSEPFVITLYISRLSSDEKNWWHTKRLTQPDAVVDVGEACIAEGHKVSG
jgi:hypothetical protein